MLGCADSLASSKNPSGCELFHIRHRWDRLNLTSGSRRCQENDQEPAMLRAKLSFATLVTIVAAMFVFVSALVPAAPRGEALTRNVAHHQAGWCSNPRKQTDYSCWARLQFL